MVDLYVGICVHIYVHVYTQNIVATKKYDGNSGSLVCYSHVKDKDKKYEKSLIYSKEGSLNGEYNKSIQKQTYNNFFPPFLFPHSGCLY